MSLLKAFSAIAALTAGHVNGLAVRQSSTGTATVDIANPSGPAKFLGSGFTYGFPDNGRDIDTSIPDSFVTDIKFHASRAGGAQILAPGWIGGLDGYQQRFDSALSNYRTTRKYGADFILLPNDLWGADGGQTGGSTFPGDNGNWTETEVFLHRLVDDIKSNNMLHRLVFDIWNEPDLDIFWARSWDQYLDYYVRAHKIIRAELPDTLISGPSAANAPAVDLDNWKAWMSAVAANDAITDIYSWHQIGDWQREPDRVVPDFKSLQSTYNLPDRPIDLNEYAWPSEQNPANGVFYLAQLERHNLRGLRANWGSGSDLHDYMADPLFKDARGTCKPNGEWHVYNVKILAGTRTVQKNYEIKISGLSKLGLPSDGSVQVRTLRFVWAGTEVEVGEPVDLGVTSLSSASDSLTILVEPPTNSTAFAFELF
ncbi:glycoside hydrolase superfamily [Colletotrichum phormii]|uniref:Glycoside hydrolase superfamily n=1 Tax=Colletotrichum phormii TaxID=359342 RepID=A0AAI9ZJP2_9PEZI|nr:glycoside hydrolase superfamily [Colletotrichum phormii]KAK1624805.1 glycoside hydrolase superfamily [Colletotrichum phormii]